MKRRQFIARVGSAAAWPVVARAQRPPIQMPRIGIIDDEPLWDNFRQGLRDLGYVENQNIEIEYRPAESRVDRLTQAARELVSLPVDVIGGRLASGARRPASDIDNSDYVRRSAATKERNSRSAPR